VKLLEPLSRIAGRLLPERVFWRVHGFVAAVITPISFSYATGHFRSSVVHRPIDRHGKPVLWMTYPTIDFLERKDFTNKTVLEWGAGQSTLWWASRASRVVSFESDPGWFRLVSRNAPRNVRLHLIEDNLSTLPEGLHNQSFDIIVIDGLNRAACTEKSVPLLAPGGALILDDSQQPWSGPGSDRYVIIDFLRDSGFQRIDFFGYAPAVIRQHCTSLFFKGECFLLAGTEVPAVSSS